MPDVLDELVIEIGLDPKKLNQGQREAIENLRKFQDEALRNAKNVESSSQRAGDALSSLKGQALELFAVFTGGKGVVEFITGLTHADAAVGRLSRSTGLSADTISRWQGAARILGGDAATMAQSFVTLSDALQGWKVGAGNPQLIADLRALATAGGTEVDINKGVEATQLAIAANLSAINNDPTKGGPAMAGFLGRRLGLDPALLDLFLKGQEVTKKVLDQVNALGPATKASADAAGELERRWNSIFIYTDGLGRQSGVIPDIIKAADILNMTPAQAWDYFTNPNYKGRAPGSPDTPGFQSGLGSNTAFTSQAEKEAFIRSEAVKRGIDPDQAMRVARSEGFDQFSGDQGTSFGAFQLHYKNNIPGLSNAGLGDAFTRDTGKDARDRSNERDTITYALDRAKQAGWGDWHGWHGAPWAGIDRSGGGRSSQTTSTVSITGPITINAGANASADDIRKKLLDYAIKRQHDANQASVGAQ